MLPNRRGPIKITIPPYTFLNFYCPLWNKIAPTTASKVEAIGIALNTPIGPAWKWSAKNQAKGSSHSQRQTKFMTADVYISPAPLNVDAQQSPAA